MNREKAEGKKLPKKEKVDRMLEHVPKRPKQTQKQDKDEEEDNKPLSELKSAFKKKLKRQKLVKFKDEGKRRCRIVLRVKDKKSKGLENPLATTNKKEFAQIPCPTCTGSFKWGKATIEMLPKNDDGTINWNVHWEDYIKYDERKDTNGKPLYKKGSNPMKNLKRSIKHHWKNIPGHGDLPNVCFWREQD